MDISCIVPDDLMGPKQLSLPTYLISYVHSDYVLLDVKDAEV